MMKSETNPPCRVVLPLWGETYIDRFSRHSLPSWLAPGNIPGLTALSEVELLVVTAPEYKEHVGRVLGESGLDDLVDLKIIEVGSDEPYADINIGSCYEEALRQPINEPGGCCYILTTADIVYADGSFLKAFDYARKGWRGLLTVNMRCKAIESLDKLQKFKTEDSRMIVNNRDLTSVALGTLAPVCESYFWNNDMFRHTTAPMNLWRVGSEAIAGIAYLRHPFMCHLMEPLKGLSGPVDYTLFDDAKIPENQIFRSPDSDDISFLEWIYENVEEDLMSVGAYSPGRVCHDLGNWAKPLHLSNAVSTFWFFGRKPSRQQITDTEKVISAVRKQIFKCYKLHSALKWRRYLNSFQNQKKGTKIKFLSRGLYQYRIRQTPIYGNIFTSPLVGTFRHYYFADIDTLQKQRDVLNGKGLFICEKSVAAKSPWEALKGDFVLDIADVAWLEGQVSAMETGDQASLGREYDFIVVWGTYDLLLQNDDFIGVLKGDLKADGRFFVCEDYGYLSEAIGNNRLCAPNTLIKHIGEQMNVKSIRIFNSWAPWVLGRIASRLMSAQGLVGLLTVPMARVVLALSAIYIRQKYGFRDLSANEPITALPYKMFVEAEAG